MENIIKTEIKFKGAVALKYSRESQSTVKSKEIGNGKALEKMLIDAIENDIEILDVQELRAHLNNIEYSNESQKDVYNAAGTIIEFVEKVDGAFKAQNY